MACTIEWCEPDKPARCFKFVLPKPTPVGKLVKKCAKAAGATHVNVQVRPRGGGNALGASDLVPSDAAVFYTAVPEAAPAAALSTSAAPAAALSTSAAPAPAPPPKAHVARYASWLRGPAAPRVASSDEAAVVAALRKRQPIVVENSSLTKSLRHWTFQYLADHSDGDVPRFHTHFAPKRRRVFPRKYGKKLMPGEAAAEEGGIVATTFRDFHELLKGARRNPAEPLAYYCQQTVLSYGDRDPDGRSPPPAGAAPMSGDHAFLEDLYEADWAWLAASPRASAPSS
ncbi:tRNA-Phe hydroxylase [Aureococcus anophagefferens]|nr:tRNA-Phe hydroxylase [Aureococcus anophagefferens]